MEARIIAKVLAAILAIAGSWEACANDGASGSTMQSLAKSNEIVLASAIDAYNNKDYERALQLAQSISGPVERNPKNIEKLIALSSYNLAGRYESGDDTSRLEAARLARLAIKGDWIGEPQKAAARVLIGRGAFIEKNYCEAIDAWESAAPVRENGIIHANLSVLYSMLGNIALARSHAERALEKGGISDEQNGKMISVLKSTSRLAGLDASGLEWLAGDQVAPASYQRFLDEVDGKAYVIQKNDKEIIHAENYVCGGRRDLIVKRTLISPYGTFVMPLLYRFDIGSNTYRAFEIRYQTGDVVDEIEMSAQAPGKVKFTAVGIDSNGVRKMGRTISELSLLPGGSVSASIQTGTLKSTLEQRTSRLVLNGDVSEEVVRVQQRAALAKESNKEASGGVMRSVIGAAVGGAMIAAGNGGAEQVLGGALKGAQIFNPDSASAAALGAAGDQMLGTSGAASSTASVTSAASGRGVFTTRPNLATDACAGFTEGNYRQKAVSGGGDQQLYAMCGQAFEYYTMYKRAIAQGYSEADANRTYAAHQQSAQVAQGYLDSHGAN